MYNIETQREVYNEETYSLFSHRPDIREKHSRMSVRPKRKGNEVDTEAILVFLSTIILFITYVCMFFF